MAIHVAWLQEAITPDFLLVEEAGAIRRISPTNVDSIPTFQFVTAVAGVYSITKGVSFLTGVVDAAKIDITGIVDSVLVLQLQTNNLLPKNIVFVTVDPVTATETVVINITYPGSTETAIVNIDATGAVIG